MYTKQDLAAQLQSMGILHTDAVMVHSSMKAVGEVEGGAETVIDVFLEYLRDGLFMTPAPRWARHILILTRKQSLRVWELSPTFF